MKKLFQRMDSISMRTLLSYFSILLVPLCVIVVIYGATMNAIVASRQEATLTALKETAHIMSARLEELGNISSYIYSDTNTNAIINRSRFEPRNRDIYTLYQALGALPSYKLTNQMIEDIFIFFNTADFVIKQPSAFAYTEQNYDAHVAFFGIDYEEIRRLSQTRYMGGLMVTGDERGRDVLLLRSIPSSTSPDGLIVIRIDTAMIDSIMGANDVGPGGGTYILTREGSVLSETGDAGFSAEALAGLRGQGGEACREIAHEGAQYLLCLTEEGGLTYLTLTGKAHLLESIAPIKLLVMLLAAAALLLGSLICILLWRRRTRVVQNIASTARSVGVEFAPAKSEEGLLEATVTSLASTVDTLRETMDRQREALSQTVVQGCLSGTFPTRADLLREVAALELPLLAPCYHVVRVSLLDPWEVRDNNAPILPYRIFLKQFFAENLRIPHVTSDIDGATFVLLLIEQEPVDAQALEALFLSLGGQLGGRDWAIPSFAISGQGDDLWEASRLYRQTEEINAYMALLEKRGVCSQGGLPRSPDALYFPMDMEIRMTQTLRSGTRQELEACFDQVMEENLRGRTLEVGMLEALFDALRRTVLRAAQSGDETEDLSGAMVSLPLVKSFNDLQGFACRVQQRLTHAAEQKGRKEWQQVKDMLERHIDENLSNPAFNVYMLSEMAGISENTLYRTFRDYFGVNFSVYLEQRRINRAFELLKNQVLIKDVAEQVGYTSDHTFRRAFKRVMKVPPSQFAKLTQ